MRGFLRATVTAAALAVAGVMLGGCNVTIDKIVETAKAAAGFTVTQQQIDAFRTTYVGFLQFAVSYGETPRCATGQNYFLHNCHEPGTLKRIKAVKDSISTGLKQLQVAIDRGDNSGAVGLFNTVKAAMQSGQSLVTALTSPPS